MPNPVVYHPVDIRDGPSNYRPHNQFVNGRGQSGWNVHQKQGWGSGEAEKRRKGGGRLAGYFGEGQRQSQFHDKADNNLSLYARLMAFIPSITQNRPYLTTRLTAPFSTDFHTIRFISLCSLWYASSALSSNTGKAILNNFRFPVTLTFVQFGFVAGYCLALSHPIIGLASIRPATWSIIKTTLPMAMFQVGGHIFSSMAISRVPVSTVHTIKALSPLFTVAAYALLFGVQYSSKTYLSLLPLTIGVMLACTFDMSASNTLGLICAFGSAIVFVSSNIFFKKIMPTSSSTSSYRLDKVNLLFYSSGLAFLLMVPIWLYSDLGLLWERDSVQTTSESSKPSSHSVTYYFFVNGIVHFAQNILAFNILSSTSPVTYSIASLIKRIAVICIAIIWFNQAIHPVQGFGIIMTFAGLWMYNAAKSDVEKGENKMRRAEAIRGGMLPTTKAEQMILEGTASPTVEHSQEELQMMFSNSSAVTRPQYLPRPHHPSIPPPPLKTTFLPPRDAHQSSSAPYPSPPSSVDSPPKESPPLPSVNTAQSTDVTRPQNLFNRRATVTGNDTPRLPPSIPPIHISPASIADVIIEDGPTPKAMTLPITTR